MTILEEYEQYLHTVAEHTEIRRKNVHMISAIRAFEHRFSRENMQLLDKLLKEKQRENPPTSEQREDKPLEEASPDGVVTFEADVAAADELLLGKPRIKSDALRGFEGKQVIVTVREKK